MPFSGCWIVDPKTINDKWIYAYCKPLPHILSAWLWPHLIFFLALSLFIQWWSCCTGGTWSRVGWCLAVYCCCFSLWRSSVWSAWWPIWPWPPSLQPSASESTSLCCRLCRKQMRDIPSSKPALCVHRLCVSLNQLLTLFYCGCRAYLEVEMSLSHDQMQKYAENAQYYINSTLKELRRLFLVQDLVDSLKVTLCSN